jgi:hypothetical protein
MRGWKSLIAVAGRFKDVDAPDKAGHRASAIPIAAPAAPRYRYGPDNRQEQA